MVVSIASIAAISAMSASEAAATFPGANGNIAYEACGPVDCGIFVVAPDGTQQAQVTHNPYVTRGSRGEVIRARDTGPAWSSDGRQIAYARHTDSTRAQLRAVNADGSGDTALGVAGWDPAWSPDGTRIAFVESDDGGYPQVFVADLVAGRQTQITHGTGAISPDWSPDGTLITYVQGPQYYPQYEIYVASPDGSGERRVTFELTDGASVINASWSPDGRRIAYSRTHQGRQSDIYSIGSDGSGKAQLTDNYVGPPTYTRIDDEAPAWSPDGASIAFVRDADGPSSPYTVFVMGSGGDGERSLVYGDQPAWQPLPLGTGRPKNAAQACKAKRESLGAEAFRQRYGGGANAHGKCVSDRSAR